MRLLVGAVAGDGEICSLVVEGLCFRQRCQLVFFQTGKVGILGL